MTIHVEHDEAMDETVNGSELFLVRGVEARRFFDHPDYFSDAHQDGLDDARFCVDGTTIGGGLISAELVGEDQIELRWVGTRPLPVGVSHGQQTVEGVVDAGPGGLELDCKPGKALDDEFGEDVIEAGEVGVYRRRTGSASSAGVERLQLAASRS